MIKLKSIITTIFFQATLALITALSAVTIIGCRESSTSSGTESRVEYHGEDKLRGRDFVRMGELTTVSGVLSLDRGEWFLENAEGAIHEIHLGDHDHRARTGIQLAEGKTARVSGFLYHQPDHENIDIAVCTIELDGEIYRFRDDNGTPLWRGQGGGGRIGASSGSGDGQGEGRGRQM